MSAADAEAAADALVARVQARPGAVLVLGGIDSGKTTLATRLLGALVDAGLVPAYIDTDVGQSTTGPPATVGWRRVVSRADLTDLFEADGLYFVGDVTPATRLLATLTGAARALEASRAVSGAAVIDTSGFVSGVTAQTLKFHKIEILRPDHVVALQRGEELEPLLAAVRRFGSIETTRVQIHPGVVSKTAEQRAERRSRLLRRYFAPPLTRYRVRAAAFMPTLPPTLDASRLHGLLAGLDDEQGNCIGIGVVEHREAGLRLAARTGVIPSALRLGAVAVDDDWTTRSIDLRSLLGSG
ncbi:MAG TPA: Clp1/GlmU family protein [Egibacteraceae bacterium]|nr:Clp1/GlmU family protein [Egibacteraceae bacterium]